MTERPILFSGPMVRAILEGRKTQTRRVVRFNSNGNIVEPGRRRCWHRDDPEAVQACPYGVPGDHLWVRETFSFLEANPRGLDLDGVWYWVDGPVPGGDWTRPKPSIHMPRWASRLTLLVKSVRVERLQEISEADARAEGVEPVVLPSGRYGLDICGPLMSGKRPFASEFAVLWDSINAKSHPWASNPWIWVVGFERVGGGS